jgi:hypothetical protein
MRIASSLVVASILIGGCIVVPLPPAADPLFEEDALLFLEVDRTTREDARSYFAEQPFNLEPKSFGNGAVWIYHSTEPGWGYFACGFGEFIGGCESDQFEETYYLVLRFKDTGVLEEYEVVTLHRGCKEIGVCRQWNGAIMVMAKSTPNFSATDDPTYSDMITCPLYLSLTTASQSMLPLTIWIDRSYIGDLTHEKGCFVYPLEPGVHTIDSSVDAQNQTIEIECRGGESIYLHSQFEMAFWTGRASLSFENLSESAARELIGTKQLALLPDIGLTDR